MIPLGKIDWAFASGKIPFLSNGEEPEFVSNDKVAVLNTSKKEARVEIFIFYEDVEPVGPYEVKVKPQRLQKVRFNDLIDPEAMRLDCNYSCYIRSNVKVVIQFSRMNTGTNSNAEMGTMAFPADN